MIRSSLHVRPYHWWLLLCVIASQLVTASVTEAVGVPVVRQYADGLELRYNAITAAGRSLTLPDWEMIDLAGYHLPAQIYHVRLTSNQPAHLQLNTLVSQPWPNTPPPATGDSLDLPLDTPVVWLGEASFRGERLASVALLPLYRSKQGWQVVQQLHANLSHVAVSTTTGQLLQRRTPFLAAAPQPQPAALSGGWRIVVDQAGIQQVSLATLTQLRPSATPLNPAQLRLTKNGQVVAIDRRSTELRFYAESPGDRWNQTATYWLTVDPAAPSPAMPQRSLSGCTTPTPTAIERGIWRDQTFNDFLNAGPSGDYWFSLTMLAIDDGSGTPSSQQFAARIPSALPLLGAATLTVEGVARSDGPHILDINNGARSASQRWQGEGQFSQTFALSGATSIVTLTLRTDSSGISKIQIDRIKYQRQVTTSFVQGAAQFDGRETAGCYRLDNLPTTAELYDITNPLNPQRLSVPTNRQYQDEPNRRYWLNTTAALHQPLLSQALPWALPTGADVIYLAPQRFFATLAPLVALRQQQGYQVALLDVQTVYDGWSGGAVSPEAIRSLMRYTAANWNPVPQVLVLVGDGTFDPFDYQNQGPANLQVIPPYMLPIDRWAVPGYVAETACDTCYALLDTDDPIDDVLPDLAVGRLPVRTVAELQGVVDKLLRYEAGSNNYTWRAKALFFTDNDFEDQLIDGMYLPDPAGGGAFASLADLGVSLLPTWMAPERVYFDPRTPGVDNTPTDQPWRIQDPVQARLRVLAALAEGQGLVTYIGHSSPAQMAVTQLDLNPNYLIGEQDPSGLQGALPVMLQLTCLTSAFHYPGATAMSLDEQFVVNPRGGAVATWGSSGYNVAFGHHRLMRGFLEAWQTQPTRPQLSSLILSGYTDLFQESASLSAGTIKTYLLLGDPLTRLNLSPTSRLYLPVTQR